MRTTGAGRNLLVLSINRAREDLTGTGPMQSERIRGLIAEQRYVQEYYENAAMPSGTLNHPSPLSPEEAELLRVKWEEINAKRSTSVLSGGIEYKPLSFNLTDSQWTEGHMVGIGDVANLFGLPGELLNYSAPGSSLTYKNIGSVFEEYWRTYARPTYATRIEEALTGLFSTSITFDPSALFAASMRDRTASTSALVSAGYDPADVLETVGLPPMEHLGGTPTTFYDDDSTADQEAPA
jgi:HK97 family phage portal protein